MYGVSAQVDVKEIEPNKRIHIEWFGDGERPTSVEWRFAPGVGDTTFVTITNWGFHGDGDEVTAQALDAMGGFTNVLAGLKAFLEHGIRLNLVADRFPAEQAD